MLIAGLLTALSFVVVAFVATAAMVLVLLAVGAFRMLRRLRLGEGLRTAPGAAAQAARGLHLGQRSRSALGATARTSRRVKPHVEALALGQRAHRMGARARAAATEAPGRADVLVSRGARTYAFAMYRLRMWTSHALRTDGGLVSSLSRARLLRVEPKQQALELNELGARLRREGDPDKAAEQHREALEIVRDLGDGQAEAMTLNNLALALANGGAEEEAVEHLEQAIVVLRALGDEEHEGLVIANLGSVHRRQGHSEEAVVLLHEALEKLPPESSAYRRVEEELRHAS